MKKSRNKGDKSSKNSDTKQTIPDPIETPTNNEKPKEKIESKQQSEKGKQPGKNLYLIKY